MGVLGLGGDVEADGVSCSNTEDTDGCLFDDRSDLMSSRPFMTMSS
jgi:hypothetical protein